MLTVLRYDLNPRITSQCYFSTGRSCIVHLIRKFGPDVVCLPAMAPEGVTRPFEAEGVKSIFYHLTDNLEPDYHDVQRRLRRADVKPKRLLFVLIHYFGYWMPTYMAAAFAQEYGGILFEDCAHCLPTKERDSCADVSLYSFNKIFPVVDGALMLSSAKAIDLSEPGLPELHPDAVEAYTEHLRANRILAAMPHWKDELELRLMSDAGDRSRKAYDAYYKIISKDMDPKQAHSGVRFEGRVLGVPFDTEEEEKKRSEHASALFGRLDAHNRFRVGHPVFAFPARLNVRSQTEVQAQLGEVGVMASYLSQHWTFDHKSEFQHRHLLLPLNKPLPEGAFRVLNGA